MKNKKILKSIKILLLIPMILVLSSCGDTIKEQEIGEIAENILNIVKETDWLKTDTNSSIVKKWDDYEGLLRTATNAGFIEKDGVYHKAFTDGLTKSEENFSKFLLEKNAQIDTEISNEYRRNITWFRSPESFVRIYNEASKKYAQSNYNIENATANFTNGEVIGSGNTTLAVKSNTKLGLDKTFSVLDRIAKEVYVLDNNNAITYWDGTSSVDTILNRLNENHCFVDRKQTKEYTESDGDGKNEENSNESEDTKDKGQFSDADMYAFVAQHSNTTDMAILEKYLKLDRFCFYINKRWETEDTDIDENGNEIKITTIHYQGEMYYVEFPQLVASIRNMRNVDELLLQYTDTNLKDYMRLFDGKELRGKDGNQQSTAQSGINPYYPVGTSIDGEVDKFINSDKLILNVTDIGENNIPNLVEAIENYEKKPNIENGTKVFKFYREPNTLTQGNSAKVETGDFFVLTKTIPSNFPENDTINNKILQGGNLWDNNLGYDFVVSLAGIPMIAFRMKELNEHISQQITDAISQADNDGYMAVQGDFGDQVAVTKFCPYAIRLEYINKINSDGTCETIESDTYYNIRDNQLEQNGLNAALTSPEMQELAKYYDVENSFKISRNGNFLLLDYLGYWYEETINKNIWTPIGRVFRIPKTSIKAQGLGGGNDYKFDTPQSFAYWVDNEGRTRTDAQYSVSIFDLCDKDSFIQDKNTVTILQGGDIEVETINRNTTIDELKGSVIGKWVEQGVGSGNYKFEITSENTNTSNSTNTSNQNYEVKESVIGKWVEQGTGSGNYKFEINTN